MLIKIYNGLKSPREFPHPLPAPLGGLGLFLLFSYAWLIIITALFDFREKTLLCQLFLKVLDGPFYLIVLYNNLHVNILFL